MTTASPQPLRKLAAALAPPLISALLTWLALSLILYGLMYGAVERTYYNWLRDLMQFQCGQDVADERLYVLRPGKCRFANVEYDTTVTVDADGYRNDPALGGRGPIPVVVTGDSHAIGWGVKDAQILSSLIARDGRWRVRNLAIPSYGTARELATLERLAPEARVIVLQYCDNDLNENLEFAADPPGFAAKARERAAGIAAWRADYTKAGLFTLTKKWLVRRLFIALVGTWRLMRLPPRAPPSDLLQPKRLEDEATAFAAVLAHHRDYLAGKRVIVFESNGWGDLRPGFSGAFRTALDKAGLNKIELVDTSTLMTRGDYYYLDDHPTAAGHAKLARRLMEALASPAL